MDLLPKIGGSKLAGSRKTYKNVETHHEGGKRVVRKVHIHRSKGHKSISVYHRSKHVKTVKRPLTKDEIHKICSRKFIPGLFDDCKKQLKTRKNLR